MSARVHYSLLLALLGGSIAAPTSAQNTAAEQARDVLAILHPAAFGDAAVLAAAEELFVRVEDQPIAEIVARRLMGLAHSPGIAAPVWRRLAALAERPKVHGLARRVLRLGLAQRNEELGDFDTAAKLRKSFGHATHALAIGPFGDEHDNYQGVSFAPEGGPADLEASPPGRYGPLRWRLVRANAASANLDLMPPYAKRRRGCHYALLQCKAKAARSAWLQLAIPDSYEAWLHGERIANVDRRLASTPVRRFFRVRLRAGWNHLLVKTTTSRSATLRASFIDDRGEAIEGIEWESKRTINKSAAAPEGGDARKDDPKARFVDSLVQIQGRQVLSVPERLLLAELLTLEGRPDDAIALIAAKEIVEDKSLAVRASRLATIKLARHLPADIRRNRMRALLSGDLATFGEHRALFLEAAQRRFADDKQEEALRAVEAALAKRPKDIQLLGLHATLLERFGLRGEGRRVFERLAQQVPDSVTIQLEVARREQRDGNPAAALARVKGLLDKQPGNRRLLARALSLSRQLGDGPGIERWLGALHRERPDSQLARDARLSWLVDQDRLDEARELLARMIQENPRQADLYRELCELLYRQRDDAGALAAAEKSLEFDPSQHELRVFSRRIAGREEFEECRPFALDAQAAATAYQERPEDKRASSTLVLDQMVIRVYEDGSQMEETHVLRRVNDARGVEQHKDAEAAAEADELLELRTILPDGSSARPHRVDGGFSMPRLVPGAFIEEHYRNYKSSPGAKPIDFARFFFRGLGTPYRMTRLVVLLPKKHALGRFVTRNMDPKIVRRRDLDDLTAWIFELRDQAPIEREPFMPPTEKIAPWVTFGRDRELQGWLRSQRASFAARTRPLREVRDKTAAVCKGKKGDLARARAIHDFAQAVAPDVRVRRGSSDPVSVLLKGEGNRFYLQLAMLRAAGVPWRAALVRAYPADADPDPEPLFGPVNWWNLPAALVEPRDGAPFWLVSGAPRHTPFAALPSLIGGNPSGGCRYLMLDDNTPGLLPSNGLAGIAQAIVRGRVTLERGGAKLSARVTIPGDMGLMLEEALRQRSARERNMWAQQMLAGRHFRGWQVSKVGFVGLDKTSDPLTITAELRRRGVTRRDGKGFVLAPMLAAHTFGRIFGGKPEREHPMLVNAWLVTDWALEIDPGQLRFAETPKGLVLRSKIFDYGLGYERRGKLLRISRRAILRPGRIEADEYAELLASCRKLDDAESALIKLRRE